MNVEHEQNQDSISETDHVYDGIREYDNPLPAWWTNLFWLTVLIAPFYMIYFHGMAGRSIYDRYDSRISEIYELRFGKIGTLQPDRETLLKYITDPESREYLAVGESTYKINCASCHGASGEGGTGPNLTDNRWKHVRRIEDILDVINNGAAGGAMPEWKGKLGHANMYVLTAAYVAALSENPVDGKEPEGTAIKPWGENE